MTTRPEVITVTSAAGGGHGSFRDAIERANALGHEAHIRFAIGVGPVTVRPDAPLPPIAFNGVVDGWTQPGFEGRPLVEIDGGASPGCAGLEIVASGVTVRGLALTSWTEEGIFVHDADEVSLVGLYVGVRLDGATAAGNGGSGIHAVRADRCLVGGAGPAAVITSGNRGHGLWLEEGARHLRLEGSFVGTDRTGSVAVPNGRSGVKVEQAHGALLGGIGDGAANVISGNRLYGIEIGGPLARGAVVVGNHVGTDLTGTVAVPNGRSGVVVYNTPDVRIGGASPREGNVISGGARGGVNLDGSVTVLEGYDYTGKGYATGNVVQGNLIGVDKTGEHPLGNQLRGVLVNFAQDNTIIDNVISANGEDGVLVLGPEDDSDPLLVPSGNRVLRNRIGVTASGRPCGNGRHGVLVRHARGNFVGGVDAEEANTIAHNGGRGVMFSGTGARSNNLGPHEALHDNGQGPFHQPRG
ncbi:hypothetical protein [Nocardioides pelophilus]|uniref:hypothetical protein n=1 Tax=Nocardioides pelophilus TaxID=2172019 RepID=UPI0015FFE4B1|nr:hypothetical protein [Nocardioides pelophilus]